MAKAGTRRRPVVDCSKDPSRTKQSERDACDINQIMDRFKRTGILPPVAREGFYADVSELGGYREVLDRVKEAEVYFAQLPANLRAEFGNDAAQFLDFVSEASQDELAAHGLVESPEKAPGSAADIAAEAKGTGT